MVIAVRNKDEVISWELPPFLVEDIAKIHNIGQEQIITAVQDEMKRFFHTIGVAIVSVNTHPDLVIWKEILEELKISSERCMRICESHDGIGDD